MQPEHHLPNNSRRRFLAASISAGAGVSLLSGCSLGVMFNKMILGDPKLPAEFRSMTKIDLTKGKHTVMVICSTPAAVDDELSTLKLDLIDGVTRRMKLNGVSVVDPDRVASWIDDHGSFRNPGELAEDFDANFIAWIDVNQFSFREDNSPKLLRGRCSGFVRVFRVDPAGDDGRKFTSTVYESEFSSTYPRLQPLSETGRSAVLFQKEYVDRVCDHLAEKFYDHRPGKDF
jgi:hypothetical protein